MRAGSTGVSWRGRFEESPAPSHRAVLLLSIVRRGRYRAEGGGIFKGWGGVRDAKEFFVDVLMVPVILCLGFLVVEACVR